MQDKFTQALKGASRIEVTSDLLVTKFPSVVIEIGEHNTVLNYQDTRLFFWYIIDVPHRTFTKCDIVWIQYSNGTEIALDVYRN